MPDLTPYLEVLATLAGFAALFAVVINVLKFFGVLSDGQAPTLSLVLNFGLLGLVIASKLFGFDILKLDNYANIIASFIAALLALVVPPAVSRLTHKILRKRVPVLGFSHS
jgi:hypothetical protein